MASAEANPAHRHTHELRLVQELQVGGWMIRVGREVIPPGTVVAGVHFQKGVDVTWVHIPREEGEGAFTSTLTALIPPELDKDSPLTAWIKRQCGNEAQEVLPSVQTAIFELRQISGGTSIPFSQN